MNRRSGSTPERRADGGPGCLAGEERTRGAMAIGDGSPCPARLRHLRRAGRRQPSAAVWLLSWRAARAWLHVLVSVIPAYATGSGDPAVRLLRSQSSLRARYRLPPTATEVPQIGTLRGRGRWYRHAARVWLHVLGSGSAASAGCEGDSACRERRSLRERSARCVLPPAVTEVPQIGNLHGRGCWDRHAERAWLLG